MKVAVIGAGWSGLAAAVFARQAGHEVTVFEASRSLGGRARALAARLPDGQTLVIDNGQHILIGAYRETLSLLRQLGVAPDASLLRLPLTLRFPQGHGLQLPALPTPFHLLAGIALAHGWPLADRLGLIGTALKWIARGFRCAESQTVSKLCQGLGSRVMQELIEPLCISALNTPPDQASGQVFLRVLRDALFGGGGSSDLLLPRTDLTRLFPSLASQWLQQHGAQVHLGHRVSQLSHHAGQWQLQGQGFDAVLLATPASDSCHLLTQSAPGLPEAMASQLMEWTRQARLLRHEAITTVYAWSGQACLPRPMLALHSTPQAPAQFVFDRGQLGGPPGLLAFVISASRGEREVLQRQVLQQASDQLGLELMAVQTVVEKRATFACLPGLRRPATLIGPGLLACGDYVDGPYPATLEGAVRNAQAAVKSLQASLSSPVMGATRWPPALESIYP